jgi:DNA (cytosine-5)-methyltransferase 1
MKKRQIFTCVETFCGAGGLGAGLKKAGFEVLFAFDYNETAVETFKNNISQRAIVLDVTKVSPGEILKSAGISKGELTLLSGGPPCQGFSRQNKDGENGDKRNRLIVKYIRIVQHIEPWFFVLENVDTFLKKRGRNYFGLINKGLSDKYEVYANEINCADYGIPQIRKRGVIIGVRRDLNIKYEFPKPTHENKWVSIGQVLKMLPVPPIDGTEHPLIPNHYVPMITELNKERISYVPQGSGRKCLPKYLQLPCHKKKTGWPDVYGRLAWNKPAVTITGGFDNFTRGMFGHPFENRPITPREAALIQGFDANFRFYGNKGEIRKQIGNAVPPPIGEIIGKSIIQAILLHNQKNSVGVNPSIEQLSILDQSGILESAVISL